MTLKDWIMNARMSGCHSLTCRAPKSPPLLITSTRRVVVDGQHTPVLFLSRYLHAHSLTLSCKKLLSRELDWAFGGGQMKGPGFGPPCSPPLAAIPPASACSLNGLVHISADVRIFGPVGEFTVRGRLDWSDAVAAYALMHVFWL